ncbi:MAG: DUF4157 domain-containing protein [Burkholderiales bacterium]
MHRMICVGIAALFQVAAYAQPSAPAEVALTSSVRVAFAGIVEGRRLAQVTDEYSQRTGALERQLKVRTARELSEADFLNELAADVRAWSDEERERVTRALEFLREPLARMPLPLPSRVVLVRMTGRVMGEQAAYTRGNEIYLPVGMVTPEVSAESLRELLAHELFHVASRQDRAWREAMYAVVGFAPTREAVLPALLQARRITNPDAPILDIAIRVSIADRGPVWVMPLLQSTIDHIGAEIPSSFLAVMLLRWLEVGRGESAPAEPVLADPPVLYDTRELQGFYDSVGRNTGYIIHAEEILASNYAQMVSGIAPQSPQVQSRMLEVMTARARNR